MLPTHLDLCPACRAKTARFAGHAVYIRKREALNSALLRSMRKNGATIRELSERFDITPRQVYRILAKLEKGTGPRDAA